MTFSFFGIVNLFGYTRSQLWRADLPSSLKHAGYFSCGMWDLVPGPGIKPGPPVLGES